MKVNNLSVKASPTPGVVAPAVSCTCNATCSACATCASCIACIFLPLLVGALGGVLASVTAVAVKSIIPQNSTTCYNGGCEG